MSSGASLTENYPVSRVNCQTVIEMVRASCRIAGERQQFRKKEHIKFLQPLAQYNQYPVLTAAHNTLSLAGLSSRTPSRLLLGKTLTYNTREDVSNTNIQQYCQVLIRTT